MIILSQREFSEAVEDKKTAKKIAIAAAAVGLSVSAYLAATRTKKGREFIQKLLKKKKATSEQVRSNRENIDKNFEELINNTSSEEKLQESIKHARKNGVPESEILHNKQEIDEYFAGRKGDSSLDKLKNARENLNSIYEGKASAEEAVEAAKDGSIFNKDRFSEK